MSTKKWYGWYVAFASALTGVSMTASFPQFTMVVEEYAAKLHTTQELLLFTDTVKSVAIMGAMLISGPVYRRLGLKRIFLCAMLSMAATQILLPYAAGVGMVLVLKVIQGFSSILFPVFLIIIMSWMDKRHVGTATAVFTGIFYGGSGLGATAAGFIIAAFGWEASFHAVALMALIPSLFWFFTVKEKTLPPELSDGNGRETDLSGANGKDAARNGKDAARLGDSGEENGLNRKRTFQSVAGSFQTWMLVLCLISTVWMVQVLSVDLPLYGSFLRYDPEAVGLVMSSLSFGFFLACVVSGKSSDYFAGRSKNPAAARLLVFACGPLLTILSILLLFVIDKSSFPAFYAAVLLLSFTGAWGLGSFYCILPELMDQEKAEYATGFIGGVADLGMPVGPLVFGVAFGVKGLWTPAWISCLIICLISVLGSAVLIRLTSRSSRFLK